MPHRIIVWASLFLVAASGGYGQTLGASRLTPNLHDNIERPLRYRPDGADFVIENGAEFFNRPLYGGNTAFRVDGGDKPEFVLYLPGRGGNLRLALRNASAAKWLHDAARIETRYRPGELWFKIHDPLLGPTGAIELAAIAYHQTEGLALRVRGTAIPDGVELVWAYGGVNGQRGKRDGDIGTENVPISEWFQLHPDFCTDNTFELRPAGFTLRARPATIVGVTPPAAQLDIGDATHWNDLPALLESATVARASARSSTAPDSAPAPAHPIVIGRVPLHSDTPLFLSLQRVTPNAPNTTAADLATYRAVTASRPSEPQPPTAPTLLAPFTATELPERFEEAQGHFATLRTRVAIETPDAFLNAAIGALNIAADAVWDEPQQAIMHGAIAWRTKLLGWRGPYSLDALGSHERARKHFVYWAGRQNREPIPDRVPPPDEKANLARNEAGLHSNGDLSNSHYDMNLVYIDALFRHLRWTGDLDFARQLWPTIERHLAWERRLFRREYGPEKLPLYEAYAAIWASDDLQYSGGGTTHASAYNLFHHREAARLARLLHLDPLPYEQEANAIARALRELLWLPDRGWFAEYRDWLGLQRVHPSAALWTVYHAIDSEVPTAEEAWLLTRYVDQHIPHLPIRGRGVPDGLYTLATSNWMPYHWSINNVVMAEVVHTALAFWQAGRADEAWRMTKGSLLAAMFMGITPGNVGSMSYLDVYRRESQRDFADGSGVLSRALIEGLFGVRPDALAGELRVAPGFPTGWDFARLRHPNLTLAFQRNGNSDTYAIEQRSARPQRLRLRVLAAREDIASLTVNAKQAVWRVVEDAVGAPQIEVTAPAAAHHEIAIEWAGAPIRHTAPARKLAPFVRKEQGRMRWRAMAERESVELRPFRVRGPTDGAFETIDLREHFNDRVTQIFRNEYRSPRSPFVSLAIPKQGIGGWAGGVNASADIDDRGLRETAAKHGGRIVLPNGVPLATPGEPDEENVVFTSLWDNYPAEATIALNGRARNIVLLLAGSTNHMQSRFENGEIVVRYHTGAPARLALVNPTTWWPIQEDYFIDDFQFDVGTDILPTRVNLKTGEIRELDLATFKGQGRKIPGGAATVLDLPLDPSRELRSLEVRTLANEVIIGLMSATLVR